MTSIDGMEQMEIERDLMMTRIVLVLDTPAVFGLLKDFSDEVTPQDNYRYLISLP